MHVFFILECLSSIYSRIKLVFLRHFSEPLTVLAIDELLGEPDSEDAAEMLEKPSSRPFLDALLSRLHHPEKSKLLSVNRMDVDEVDVTASPSKKTRKGKERAEVGSRWRVASTSEVLQLTHEARKVHQKRALGSRTAFQVFLLARNYVIENGFKSLLEVGYRGEGRKGVERTVCEMMINCVRGTLPAKDGRRVAAAIRLDYLCCFVTRGRKTENTTGNSLKTIFLLFCRRCIPLFVRCPLIFGGGRQRR